MVSTRKIALGQAPPHDPAPPEAPNPPLPPGMPCPPLAPGYPLPPAIPGMPSGPVTNIDGGFAADALPTGAPRNSDTQSLAPVLTVSFDPAPIVSVRATTCMLC